MNTQFVEMINQLESIVSSSKLLASEVDRFQEQVWNLTIHASTNREYLMEQILAELAYDLEFIDRNEGSALKEEINRSLLRLSAVRNANEEELRRMIEEMERPELEAARKRKKRFVAGPDGTKDTGC